MTAVNDQVEIDQHKSPINGRRLSTALQNS